MRAKPILLSLSLISLLAGCQLWRASLPAGPLTIPGPQLSPSHTEWSSLAGFRSIELQVPVSLVEFAELEVQRVRLDTIEAVLAKRGRRLSAYQRARVAEELRRAEGEYGLDALLLLALIDQESSYNPRARGPKGSLGLMQVRPFVGRDVAKRKGIPWRGPATLVDPALNVRIGVAYLAEMKQMYPEESLALAAYNMGPYRVKRLLSERGQLKTRYARSVLARYENLRRRLPASARH